MNHARNNCHLDRQHRALAGLLSLLLLPLHARHGRHMRAQITDRKNEREVHGLQHLGCEQVQSQHVRREQPSTGDLFHGISNVSSPSSQIVETILTIVRRSPKAIFSWARCQYAPVRHPKEISRVTKTATKTMLVRTEQRAKMKTMMVTRRSAKPGVSKVSPFSCFGRQGSFTHQSWHRIVQFHLPQIDHPP